MIKKTSFVKKNHKFQKPEDQKSENKDESTCSESESEETEFISEEMDKDWFKAYNAIKNNDPSIYDASKKFYKDIYEKESRPQKKLKTSENLYDAEVKYLTEPNMDEIELEDVGHHEKEEEELKDKFAEALRNGMDDDDDDDILIKNEDGLDIKNEEIPELENEKFLRQYVFNQQHLLDDDEDDDEDDDDDKDEENNDHINGTASLEENKLSEMRYDEDEEELEKESAFERKYNFRFEEPDEEFIKTYPRTVANSVRKKKNMRSEKRKAVKERKAELHVRGGEEVGRVRSMQVKECSKMLMRLEGKDLDPCMFDLEGDFDQSFHDALMKKHFGNDFYATADDEKPTFEDDDDDKGLNYDAASKSSKEPAFAKASKKKMQKYSRMVEELEVVEETLPFNYKSVYATDYGMSAEEILMCDDHELNSWLPIRKIITCKTDEEEAMLDRSVRRDARKKRKVCKSLYGDPCEKQPEKKKIGEVKEEMRADDNDDGEIAVVKKWVNDDEGDNYDNSDVEDKVDNNKKKIKMKDETNDEDIEKVKKNTENNKLVKSLKKKQENKNKKDKKKDNLGNDNDNKMKQKNECDKKTLEKVGDGVKKEGVIVGNISCDDNVTKSVVKAADSMKLSSGGDKASNKTTKIMEKKLSNEKKNKMNKKKKQKKKPALTISEDRLKAYQILPKKFKYHYLPKINKEKKTAKE